MYIKKHARIYRICKQVVHVSAFVCAYMLVRMYVKFMQVYGLVGLYVFHILRITHIQACIFTLQKQSISGIIIWLR